MLFIDWLYFSMIFECKLVYPGNNNCKPLKTRNLTSKETFRDPRGEKCTEGVKFWKTFTHAIKSHFNK
ncbi:MAG: hypothetical protein K0Q95_463 [Bacteroidota bacterium]|jgi:hypothetical protein|nr:hypothetical protein [Bacteroidota bacterium]